MVLAIPITTDDRNMLGWCHVESGSDRGKLCESEDLDEEFGEDVK